MTTGRLWPQQECFHEHTNSEARIVNGAGQVVRIAPKYCYDCGYKFPIDASSLQEKP